MARVFRNYAPGLGARGEREPGGGCWSPGNDERSTECSFRPPLSSRLSAHQEGWTPPSLVVASAACTGDDAGGPRTCAKATIYRESRVGKRLVATGGWDVESGRSSGERAP